MFHARDGLFFERQPNGGVRLIKRTDTGHSFKTDVDITLTQESFASAVASMAPGGETQDSYASALAMLRGEHA